MRGVGHKEEVLYYNVFIHRHEYIELHFQSGGVIFPTTVNTAASDKMRLG